MTDRSEPLIAKARRTNATFDTMERTMGTGPLSQFPPGSQIRTAMQALKTGMALQNGKGWECVAEAYVMLETVEPIVRTKWPESTGGGVYFTELEPDA